MKNMLKRTLSVLLALALVATGFAFFNWSALFPKAAATEYAVKIAVPETVYINPKSMTTAEYCVNNTLSRTVRFQLLVPTAAKVNSTCTAR